MNPGAIIAGTDYEIIREIGRGSTAITYLARHRTFGQTVAIKLVQPLVYLRRHTARRFVREARALARIRHPHVVELYEGPELAGGLRCLVMEYIEGESLADVLAHGRPSVALSVRWIVQALEGLQAAHESHVLHRDLKPGNLFIRTRDNSCVLIDFGFCKGDSLDSHYTTTEGVFVGTPHYASPEQTARKKTLTPASDVYAMGVILYECLTGVRLFGHLSTREILLGRRREAPPSLLGCGYIPGSERLEKTITRALAEDPEDRFHSAAEMALELDRYLVEELHNPSARLTDIPSVEMQIGAPRGHQRSMRIAGIAAACACALGTMVHLSSTATVTHPPVSAKREYVQGVPSPLPFPIQSAPQLDARPLASSASVSGSVVGSGSIALPRGRSAILPLASSQSVARSVRPAPAEPSLTPLNLGVIQ